MRKKRSDGANWLSWTSERNKTVLLNIKSGKWKNCEVETLKMWWNKQLLLIEVQYHRDHSCLQLFYIYTFTTRILSQENSILLGHDIDLI